MRLEYFIVENNLCVILSIFFIGGVQVSYDILNFLCHDSWPTSIDMMIFNSLKTQISLTNASKFGYGKRRGLLFLSY